MKKIMFLVLILITLVSCVDSVIEPPTPVLVDPTVTLKVSKDTASPGDLITITVFSANADKTLSNIDGAPTTTSWSYDLLVTETFIVSVKAIGSTKESVPATKQITVINIVVPAPTRTDSICSKPLHLIAMETLDKNGNLLSSSILDEEQLSNVFYFYKDGSAKGFRKDGSLLSSGAWKWTGVNTIVLGSISGGDEYIYSLTDKNFITYRACNDTIMKVTYKLG